MDRNYVIMDKDGHLGFSLTIYFSIAYLLGQFNSYVLAIGLLSSFLSSIPDIDIKLRIKHRGVTHSIFTGIILGVVAGYGTYRFLDDFLIGFSSITLAFIFHILGDLMTYREFNPIYPIGRYYIAFKLFRSDNKVVNRSMLIIGSVVLTLYLYKFGGLDILSLILKPS